MLRCALTLAVVALGFAHAPQSPDFRPRRLSQRGRAAYETLLDARLFAVGGVGYAGRVSEGEGALRLLLAEPEARAALESLAARATREGGLYALLGLRVKGFDSFAVEAKRFRERADGAPRHRPTGAPADLLEIRPGEVAAAAGCLFYSEAWEKVLERIEAGEYDSRFPAARPAPGALGDGRATASRRNSPASLPRAGASRRRGSRGGSRRA